MEKKLKVEVSEMFMAKTSVDDCHFGIIKRGKDEKGNPYVFSRIRMPDGLLCAREDNQKILGENLDKMCVMVLKKGIPNDTNVSSEIFRSKFFHN